MKRFTGLFALALTLTLTTGCGEQLTASYPPDEGGASHLLASQREASDPASSESSALLQKELAALRTATSKYQDVQKAEADGYQEPSHFVPGMGFHYMNLKLLGDGQVDVHQPEVLVYDSNDPDRTSRNLGAVEYMILDPDKEMSKEELPMLFTGQTKDDWHYVHHGPGFWSLHAWIWLDNPNGLFHGTNPRVDHGS